MKKGKSQIEQDVYDTLAPFFVGKIGGALYQSDTRPRDSHAEDAVIVASTPTGGQIQTGRVRILIFVPDFDNGSGRNVPDIDRIQQLEQFAQPIIDALNDALPDYSFDYFTAAGNGGDPKTSEHFVDIHLTYYRKTF